MDGLVLNMASTSKDKEVTGREQHIRVENIETRLYFLPQPRNVVEIKHISKSIYELVVHYGYPVCSCNKITVSGFGPNVYRA